MRAVGKLRRAKKSGFTEAYAIWRKIAKGNNCMDRNQFKLIHSELIQQVQCVENNLKIIYAAMHKGNFNNNLKSVEKMNLGKIARELEELDNSDDMPEFSEEEYNTIDEIRNKKLLVPSVLLRLYLYRK